MYDLHQLAFVSHRFPDLWDYKCFWRSGKQILRFMVDGRDKGCSIKEKKGGYENTHRG